MDNGNKKVAIVTGSSTGIGFETSILLAQNGYLVYATLRDMSKSSKLNDIIKKENLSIKLVVMDVDDDNSVKSAINQIISNDKRIDVIVNNAGYGLFGALEDLSIDEIKQQFETNVFGSIRIIQNVLPLMRSQKSGIIVNISSISGLVGIPSESVYCGTKFALEGISESLSYEVEPFGIKIILIEPGVINTEFIRDLVVPDNYGISKPGTLLNNPDSKKGSNSPYSNTVGKFLSFYYNAMNNAPHPRIVAEEIMKSIEYISRNVNISPLLRINVGNDSVSFGRLKKELKDDGFHEMLKNKLIS